MLMTPLFHQCQKAGNKSISPTEYLSNEHIINLETLNEFYSIAIRNTKQKSNLKNSDLIISDIENQVVQMCNEKFGVEFYAEYTQLKNLTNVEQIKSSNSEEYMLSEYAKNLFFEIDENIGNLFDDEVNPSNEEMQVAISNLLLLYQEQIANDIQLTVVEKSTLITSIQGQIIMLPNTFEVADLLFQNIDDVSKSEMLKKGWLKKTWKKIKNFVTVVSSYTLLGYLVGGSSNIYGIIGGAVVGIGTAIYCEIEGYNHCICNPVYCFINSLSH